MSAAASQTIRSKSKIGERLLLSLARDPGQRGGGATGKYTLGNCLHFARLMFPDFDELIRGRSVLDYGCGYGWQAIAMRLQCGAASVFGLDIVPDLISRAQHLAQSNGCGETVKFGSSVPSELDGKFDVVLSLSAFEHYADPAAELEKMRRHVKPGGIILLAFAEPWWSPFGSHFQGYARIPGTDLPFPWMNVFFSDSAMLALRSRFRSDRPTRIEDVEGGLNRMTVKRFENIVNNAAYQVEHKRLVSVKGLPLVTQIPLIRELLTNAAGCVLRVRESQAARPATALV